MSIRIKILLILTLGLLVAFGVSALAFVNAIQLDRRIEAILTQTLDNTQTMRQANELLRELRVQEQIMIAGRRESHSGELDGLLSALQRHFGNARLHASELDLLRQGVADYRARWTGWNEVLGGMRTNLQSDAEAISAQGRELSDQLTNLRAAMRPSVAPSTLLKLPFIEHPLTISRDAVAIDDAQSALLLGQALSEVSFWVGFSLPDAETDPLPWRSRVDVMQRRIAELKSRTRALNERLETLGVSTLGPTRALTALDTHANTFLTSFQSHLATLDARSGDILNAREQLEVTIGSMIQKMQSQIDTDRHELNTQRSLALVSIASIVVLGLVLVGFLGAVLSRGMSRSFRQLLSAARDIQQGNFNARVRIRTRDELHELGQAFNAMARYLEARREQQVNYNEIVSLINSTLDIRVLLGGSLQEIVRYSNSAVGAFYLPDESGDNLVLAESFGMLQDSQPLRYRLGEGLVGQAAKSRRKILVNHIPQGSFEIDVGFGAAKPSAVLILPVVHIDRLLGVFTTASPSPYTEETITFIEEAVFQVGVALNNAFFVSTIEATAAALREKTDELITQRSELENVNRELEDASRLQSDFLANVTHELRTPLNSIIGFTELVLDRREVLDEKVQRHLETVLRNATGLLGLINDLLDITKIEAGRSTLNISRFSLDELIEESLQTISPLVDNHRVTLESRLEEKLPPMRSDRTRLKQIMLNLLSNAAKFTEEGAIRVDTRRVKGGRIEIAVVDSGIGIHSEDLPYIFDKFRQVDGSISRKYGGTGLGLAITSELVRLLDGTILAKSEFGAGSTFVLVLPIDAYQAADSPESFPTPSGGLERVSEFIQPAAATASEEVRVQSLVSLSGLPAVTPVARKATPPPAEDPVPEPPPGTPTPPRPAPVVVLTSTILPSSPPTPSAHEEVSSDASDEEQGPARTHLVVLDGHPNAVIQLRAGLRNESFEVMTAFICADAVEAFEEIHPAALLLGDPMPESDQEALLDTLSGLMRARSVPLITLGDAHPAIKNIEPFGHLSLPIDAAAALALFSTLEEDAPSLAQNEDSSATPSEEA